MERRTTVRKLTLLAGLLIFLCTGSAYAATYEQGYTVGCNIAQGVYGENRAPIYSATFCSAWDAGLFEYALGVHYGYLACQGPPAMICPLLEDPDPPLDPLP